LALLFIAMPALFGSTTTDAAVKYRIDQEWVVVWVNPDGSVDLQYNITITYESSAQGYLTIGMPKAFNVTSARGGGGSLQYSDVSSGNYHAVEVYFGKPMVINESASVLLLANVPNMVYKDTMNPGNVGLQFTPSYYSDAIVRSLRLAIVPPPGVNKTNIKTSETAYFTEVEGEFAVYWEREDVPAGTVLTYGISFPEEFAMKAEEDGTLGAAIALIAVAAFIIFAISRSRKKVHYDPPTIAVEALGPARGLTAVEAAVVVGVEPVRVLTMVLFGLLKKRLVKVKETDPVLKLELASKEIPPGVSPRYYELDFIRAIKPDGALDEFILARCWLYLRDAVDKKVRGYSRADTVNYYKSVVNEAWGQVLQASTPELKGDLIDEKVEWLLLDGKYKERFGEAFPPNVIISPRPEWWWYWHGPYRPSGGGAPQGTPQAPAPIPGQEWANGIVLGMEKAANKIVLNVQEFANKLVPAQPARPARPAREGGRCVCACANCACACACVSCACACAGGGAR